MKLSPYQERLCKLRCEQRLSESEIAQLLHLKPQTIRFYFSKIREILKVQTFDDAWREYKKTESANQHVEYKNTPKSPLESQT